MSDTPETDDLARGNHVVPTEWAEQLERERDEAREDLDNMQDQRDLAMKVIKRLEQERDEAREKLNEEMKWHHQTHKELVEAQCKLLDIEYDKLKS
jgi:predicted  nucleic acid-binding Zn-ribbon protein